MNREEVLNAVAEMSVLELSQLIKDMEQKFDVSASAAVAVAAPAAGEAGGDAGAAEEQGSARNHRSWPERSQGSGRVGTHRCQGRRHQG